MACESKYLHMSKKHTIYLVIIRNYYIILELKTLLRLLRAMKCIQTENQLTAIRSPWNWFHLVFAGFGITGAVLYNPHVTGLESILIAMMGLKIGFNALLSPRTFSMTITISDLSFQTCSTRCFGFSRTEVYGILGKNHNG